MTTRVIIELPDNNHADEIDIFTMDKNGLLISILATLKQGERTEQYVHSGQDLVIVERMEEE